MKLDKVVVVLGAADPEMAAIERVCQDAGLVVAYAVDDRGNRVHPGNAYRACGMRVGDGPVGESVPKGTSIWWVECRMSDGLGGESPVRDGDLVVDHHRPGDPGYGRPPEEFMAASSIGQVLAALGRWGYAPARAAKIESFVFPPYCWLADPGQGPQHVRAYLRVGDRDTVPVWHLPVSAGFRPTGRIYTTKSHGYRYGSDWDVHVDAHEEMESVIDRYVVPTKIVLTAAADHCLEAAYRGRCPGVDPDELMRWRAESRAAFQGRPVDAVLADVEAARRRLRECGAVGPAVGYHPVMRDGVLMGYAPDGDDYPISAVRHPVADLRGEQIPELPEAAAREGIPFLADQTDRDGRRKVVLMAAPPELVARFLRGEIVPGLVDMYGDPARGFAGGYKEPQCQS